MAEMARNLRQGLGGSRASLRDAVAQQRSAERSWLTEIAKDRHAVQDEWRRMSVTLKEKRSGTLAAAPPATVKAEPATQGEEGEDEDVASAEVGEVTEDLASIGARLVERLANHPEGQRLIQLEQEFGLNRFQAARIMRYLIDTGRVEKRGLSYFTA